MERSTYHNTLHLVKNKAEKDPNDLANLIKLDFIE